MFNNILKLTLAEVDGNRAMNDLVERWTIDRWFSFSGMLRSCRYDVEKMNEYGLDDARVEEFPADGKTYFGYWRMPLAWDPVDAKLWITSPAGQAGKVLAHYRSQPCSLAMWTPSTPKRGVEGEVAALDRGDRDEDYRGVSVRGKFILTNQRGSAVRNQAIKRGALGVISDTSRWPHEQPDAVDWMNAWSEDPCGWGLTKGEKTILGFNLSHRQGRELRALIQRAGSVRLKAVAETRLYSGVMPAATACVRGRTNEEVLTLGHGAEQGAVDNSSGCAVMLEALRVLRALVAAGKLPRPRRSIRMLITWEVYATLAFFAKHRGLARRTVAGLCLDSVAQSQALNNSPLGLYRNPHANASCADTLLAMAAEKTWPAPPSRCHFYPADYSMTDNVTAHPGIGIPTPWLGILGHRQWHTNLDTPDKIDVAALGRISALVAAYLYFFASAGEKEGAWLADATSADWRAQLARAGVDLALSLDAAKDADGLAGALAGARERVDYLRFVGKKAVVSARKLSPKRAPRLERAIDAAVNMLNESAADERARLDNIAREIAAGNGWPFRLASLAQGPERVEGRLSEAAPAPSDEMKRAAEMIVERSKMGPIAFDGIPLAKRKGLDDGRWGGPLQTVLMWCNGKRTLAEAIRLASQEMRQPIRGIVAQIDRCAKLRLVRVRSS